ncbi:MAG: 50S ribosomal protein L17 [Chitinophagales bacterium]|nr:MAG: 50S ribosomal protein L17 [Chitinophagales bacterium]
MRHGRKINHLGRDTQHRKALLSNLANSLILHKRINTTLAKAKELRKFVEPLITKGKNNSTHSRRIVFSYLQNKEAVKELFGPVAEKTASRPGGYTRIIKLGYRQGDAAEMAMIELVDFNDLYVKEKKTKAEGRKRTRRGRGKSSPQAEAKTTAPQEKTSSVSEQPPADTPSSDDPAAKQ